MATGPKAGRADDDDAVDLKTGCHLRTEDSFSVI
jgi:hypothetical protein